MTEYEYAADVVLEGLKTGYTTAEKYIKNIIPNVLLQKKTPSRLKGGVFFKINICCKSR